MTHSLSESPWPHKNTCNFPTFFTIVFRKKRVLNSLWQPARLVQTLQKQAILWASSTGLQVEEWNHFTNICDDNILCLWNFMSIYGIYMVIYYYVNNISSSSSLLLHMSQDLAALEDTASQNVWTSMNIWIKDIHTSFQNFQNTSLDYFRLEYSWISKKVRLLICWCANLRPYQAIQIASPFLHIPNGPLGLHQAVQVWTPHLDQMFMAKPGRSGSNLEW